MNSLTEYMGFGVAHSAAEQEPDIYDRLDDIRNRLPNVDTFEELDSYQRFIDSSIAELIRDEVQQYERLPQVVQEARIMAEEFVETGQLPRLGYIPRNLVYALTDIVNLQQTGSRVEAKREEIDTRRRREEAQPSIEEGLTRGNLYEPGLTDIVNSYIGNGNIFSWGQRREPEDDFLDPVIERHKIINDTIVMLQNNIDNLNSLDNVNEYREAIEEFSSAVQRIANPYLQFTDLIDRVGEASQLLLLNEEDESLEDRVIELLVDDALDMPDLLEDYSEEQVPSIVYSLIGADVANNHIRELFTELENKRNDIIGQTRERVTESMDTNLSRGNLYEPALADIINSYVD